MTIDPHHDKKEEEKEQVQLPEEVEKPFQELEKMEEITAKFSPLAFTEEAYSSLLLSILLNRILFSSRRAYSKPLQNSTSLARISDPTRASSLR
jgi:hypothetical protein